VQLADELERVGSEDQLGPVDGRTGVVHIQHVVSLWRNAG
jgi:hypothetical protein